MSDQFRREISVTPYDGASGVHLRFHLIGPIGATQFVVVMGHGEANPIDIGYHSHRPMYDGQAPMDGECEVIGGTCYYDGSTLQARDFMPEFLAGGDEAVWRKLEEVYHARFGDAVTAAPIPS